MTFPDKISNMYRLSKDDYNSIMRNAVTTIYEKTRNNTNKKINQDGKCILKNKTTLNRIEINGESNCFIAVKDHQENFANNPTTSLINPAKNKLARINQVILSQINSNIHRRLNFNQ